VLAGCGGGPTADHDHGSAEAEAGHHAHEEEAGHDEHGHDDEGGVVELSPEAIARIGLETVVASRRPLEGRRVTTGRVGFDERRVAHVSPRVSGRLLRVTADLGDDVRASEALAVLDSAELGQARAAHLRARARVEVARRRYEQQRALHAEEVISELEVLETEADLREHEAAGSRGRATCPAHPGWPCPAPARSR
jgi:cobalt-zinc-cadmium efflux system membrane fusion protein